VLYDRTSPPDARLASFWSLWGLAIIGGMIVTASITNEAVDELKLTKGMAAAVIKASDVMIAVD
jgi:molybdopterin-binding protein